MYNAKLDRFIHEVVRQYPEPVRLFRSQALWRCTLFNRTGLLIGLQLLFLCGIGAYSMLNPASTWFRMLLGIGLVVIALGAISLILWRQWFLGELIRYGVNTTVDVLQVELLAPGAVRYRSRIPQGLAVGRYRMYIGQEQYTAKFEIDHPWNQRIRNGTRISILVHPKSRHNPYPLEFLG